MTVGPMDPWFPRQVFMCNVFNCQPADPLSTSIGGPPLPEGDSLGGSSEAARLLYFTGMFHSDLDDLGQLISIESIRVHKCLVITSHTVGQDFLSPSCAWGRSSPQGNSGRKQQAAWAP